MKTLRVKVTPNVKVTKSKKNGLYIKRFKTSVSDDLSVGEVKAILQLYVRKDYNLSVDICHDNDRSWTNVESYSFKEAKELLSELEFYYYKEITKWVYNATWNKIAYVKVSSCFDVELQERSYEGYRIAFFHIVSKAKDIKHVPDALVESLNGQSVECRISVDGTPYVFTPEQEYATRHFRLVKEDSITYSLEKISISSHIEHPIVKVLF